MAPGPNTEITTMRLPKDLKKILARRAKKLDVTRTRLVVWLLRDCMGKSDAELRDIVTGPSQEVADVNQHDLFA